jgi:hypothetical protein
MYLCHITRERRRLRKDDEFPGSYEAYDGILYDFENVKNGEDHLWTLQEARSRYVMENLRGTSKLPGEENGCALGHGTIEFGYLQA